MASTASQKSALNIVMVSSPTGGLMTDRLINIRQGAMTFGEAGKEGARVHDLKDVEAILDVFRSHGHTEVGVFDTEPRVNFIYISSQIDTARVYCSGTSEEYLGKIDWDGKGFKLETKLYPAKVIEF
jgi:aflatoxin B1 aldehyde reductase